MEAGDTFIECIALHALRRWRCIDYMQASIGLAGRFLGLSFH
jgi:hypothetical protein